MAEAVYIVCTLASVACALLLWNGYRKSRAKLLFWSALCFMGLAANNVLLVVDLALIPQVDLALVRSGVALTALLVLLYGLVWEQR